MVMVKEVVRVVGVVRLVGGVRLVVGIEMKMVVGELVKVVRVAMMGVEVGLKRVLLVLGVALMSLTQKSSVPMTTRM